MSAVNVRTSQEIGIDFMYHYRRRGRPGNCHYDRLDPAEGRNALKGRNETLKTSRETCLP